MPRLSLGNEKGNEWEKRTDWQRRFEELQKETVDWTKGESDVCPVHHLKIPAREVPVFYGMRAVSGPIPAPQMRASKLPLAQSSVIGGCIVSRDSPKIGKVYLCAKCAEAEKA